MSSPKSPLFVLGLAAVAFATGSIWWTIQPAADLVTSNANSPLANESSVQSKHQDAPSPGPILSFEENRGQFDKRVRFLSRGPGYRFFLGSGEAALVLTDHPKGNRTSDSRGERPNAAEEPAGGPHKESQWVVRWRLEGGNQQPGISGLDLSPTRNHYFQGRAAGAWHRDVPSYKRVRYENVYPGIDLIYYYRDQQLEFDFLLQPGADARMIRLNIDGAEARRVDREGRLLIKEGERELLLGRPRVFQTGPGAPKSEIKARYSLLNSHTVGFEVEGHNPEMAMLIDPAFVYSTYYGGSASDECQDMQVDAAGNAYVVGYTDSTNFPTTSGVVQTAKRASTDAFVIKMNSAGQPVFSTYLGGAGSDYGYGIAVDAQGNLFVSGRTRSDDFPTTAGAYRRTRTGTSDIFVAKLNSAGSGLTYSTFLGGSDASAMPRIAVDVSGNAYIAGETSSAAFPVVSAHQSTLKGTSDAFLVKLNNSGTAALYSTYLGGTGSENVGSVAVDQGGYAWVVGRTQSSDFPLRSALQGTSGGGEEAFISKFAANGALAISSYLGGRDADVAADVALDASGNAYVTGYTLSNNFRVTQSVIQPAIMGTSSAYVTKIRADGGAFVYSTYLGAYKGMTRGGAIAVDNSGSAIVTGYVEGGGASFPLSEPVQPSYGNSPIGHTFNSAEAFVTKLAPDGTSIPFSSWLGGWATDYGRGIGVDSSGNIYVAGSTNSTDNFPIANAFRPSASTPWEVFITKIDPTPYAGAGLPPIPGAPWTRRMRVDSNHNGVPDAQDESSVLLREGDTLRLFSSRWPGDAEMSSVVLSNPHPLSGFYQTLTRRRFHYYEVGTGLKFLQTLVGTIDGYDANLRPISASVTETWDQDAGGIRRITTKTGGLRALDSNADGLYESMSVTFPNQAPAIVNVVRVDVNADGKTDFLTIPWALVQTAGLATSFDPQVFIPIGDTNGDGIADAPAFDFDGDGRSELDLPSAPFAAGPSNPAVEHKLYFAHFGEGQGILSSQIMLMNLDRTRSAHARVLLKKDDGAGMSVDLNGAVVNGETAVDLPAGGLKLLQTDGLGAAQAGSVTVISDRPLAGVILFGGTTGLAGVGNSVPLSKGFTAPVEAKAGVNTGLAVMNLGSAAANLTFELFRQNNTLLATGSPMSLARDGHRALFLSEIQWSPAVDFSNFSGILRVTAPETLAAMVLRVQTAPLELAAMPVAPRWGKQNNGIRFAANRPETPLDYFLNFPQFADGAGTGWSFASQVTLLNLDPWLPAKARLSIRQDNGTAMNVDLNGVVVNGFKDVTIPAGGVAELKTDGAGSLQVGCASVMSDRPLAGVILYGSTYGTAGVGSCAELGKTFVAPVENHTGNGVGTGIALMNLEAAASTVTIELLDENSNLKSTSTVPLAANGHAAKMVYELTWSPNVDLSNFKGTIRAASTRRVAGAIIRTQFNRYQYGTLPVSPRLN